MLFSRKRELIGLDIGSNSIKLVQIARTKKGLVLKNLGIVGLPPDTIIDGAIQDREKTLEAIRHLVDQLNLGKRYVATSISGHSAIIKRVSLPVMDEEELRKSIIWEAEPYIPYDVKDVNIDFKIIGESEKTPDKMDVLLVTAKKDAVEEYAGIIESAGLIPTIVDVGCFALANVYEVNYPLEDEGCFVLVDIGAETMSINAIKGEIPIFTKESSLGGSQITKQIQSVWGVEYEEAEHLKIGGTTDKTKLKELQNIFVSIAPTWSAEIKQAVDLLSTSRTTDVVGKILLSGGSSRIPGIDELIGKTTNIPVEILNPFLNVDCNEKNFNPEYVEYMAPQVATCVGLALREVGDK